MNILRRACLLLALASAVVSAGVTSPLHELEALVGHETHRAQDGSPGISHACHDEDACVTCRLLSLSHVSAPAAPPDLVCGEVSWSLAAPAAEVRAADEPAPFAARGPPA